MIRHLVVLSFLCSCTQFISKPLSLSPKSSTAVWTPGSKYETPSFFDEESELPDMFEELHLSGVVDIALKNNPETKVSWEKARMAAAYYGISQADLLPDIQLGADVTKQHQSLGVMDGQQVSTSSINTLITSDTSAGPTLSLSYTLWDFGERTAKANSTLQALYYANFSHNEMIQEVMQKVINAYYEYLYEVAKYISIEADLKDAETSYNAAMLKLENGVADVSDMLQARTQYLQIKLNLAEQVAVKETALSSLYYQMGVPSNFSYEFGHFPNHPEVEKLEETVEELLVMAKDKRPDIAAAKAEVVSKMEYVKEQKAKLFPKISTNLSGGERWYNVVNGMQNSYNLELLLTYPIFSGFKYMNQIKQAEAELGKMRANLRLLELDATKEVTTYYTDYKVSIDLLEFSKEYLDSAAEEYTAVLANYQMGTNTILDVLTAQASLADARTKYDEAKKKLYSSMTNLAYATGTLTNKFQKVRSK